MNGEKKIVGIGYNGMPIGCSDDELPWQRTAENKLDTKYPYGNLIYNCKFVSTEIQENVGSPKHSVASSLGNTICILLWLIKNCTETSKSMDPNCLGCKDYSHASTHHTHTSTQAHTHDTLFLSYTFSVFLEITLPLF